MCILLAVPSLLLKKDCCNQEVLNQLEEVPKLAGGEQNITTSLSQTCTAKDNLSVFNDTNIKLINSLLNQIQVLKAENIDLRTKLDKSLQDKEEEIKLYKSQIRVLKNSLIKASKSTKKILKLR